MHWGIFGLGGVGGLAAVTAVVVNGDELRRYPVPASVARERLASAPLPQPLLAIAGGRVAVLRQDGALVWQLGDSEHRSVGRAEFEADGASTDVRFRFDLADNALGGSPIGATTLTKSMAEEMFVEHVDSVLGGRPFDMQRMGFELAREMQANPQMLKDYGDAVGQHFNEVATMLNENSEFSTIPSAPRVDGRDAVEPNRDSYQPTTRL